MSAGFTLLWQKILDSSVWMESKETRLVWITMLAMKDSDGRVLAAAIGLAHRARVTPEECETALDIFLSPDPGSSSQVEEGRRIRVIPGGWQIINHEQYRFSTEAKREFWRNQKRVQREKKKDKKPSKSGAPTNAERHLEEAQRNGDEAEARRIRELMDKVPPGTYSADPSV